MKYLLLLLSFSVFAAEDAYIQFPDGSLVENPFHPTFFEDEVEIPAGFADPKMSMTQLVDGADPAGFGTSCDLYQGEQNVVDTLQKDFGLSKDNALRCLDLVNTSGMVMATAFALKDNALKEDSFMADIEELEISNSLKLRYKKVVRDTLRAIRKGLTVDPYSGVYAEEEARSQLLAKILVDCAHALKEK